MIIEKCGGGVMPAAVPSKLCRRCGTVKALTDFYVRKARKGGRQSCCAICQRELRSKQWHEKEKLLGPQWHAAEKQRKSESYRANIEREKDLRKKWREANPDHSKNAGRRYRERHPNAHSERESRHPGYSAAAAAKRRAAKRQATPNWADLDAILKLYEEAKARTEQSGQPWHVDHIIPLTHDLVCGLHVPANLQLLPGVENIRKNNRFSAE